MKISRRQAIKLGAAALVAPVPLAVSIQDTLASSQWFPPLSGLNRYLIFNIETGGDDVRSGSSVSTNVGIRGSAGATSWFGGSLNNGSNWPNWTWHRALIDLNAWRRIDNIQEFYLSFLSGLGGPFDSQDNWNLEVLHIHYMPNFFGGPPDPNAVDLTRMPLIFAGSADPFIRFTGSNAFFHTQTPFAPLG